MEDPNNQQPVENKPADQVEGQAQPPPVEEFSLDDIDQFLKAEDPEFVNKLAEISADKNLHAIEIEVEDKRTLFLRMKEFFWKWSVLIANGVEDQSLRVYKFLLRLARSFLGLLREGFLNLKSSTQSVFTAYSRLSGRLKLAFVGTSLLAIGFIGAFYWVAKTNWIFQSKALFMTSFADRAEEAFTFDESDHLEPFLDNIRSTPNILLIEKSVVNIRPSASSGSNPMVAFELFIEGFNPEVVAEIKRREGFYRDIIHQTTSKFSYDELEYAEGKKELLGVLQKELNSVVQRGQIKAIRLKTIVLKP